DISSKGTSDKLNVTGASTGSTNVVFMPTGTTHVFFNNQIPVIVSGSGSLQATAQPQTTPGGVGLPGKGSGLIFYTLDNVGPGSWSVTSRVDLTQVAPTLTSILGSLASIDTSFHQPASALVASLQVDQPNKWSGGPWVRASGGKNDVASTGTETLPVGGNLSANSLVQTSFTGIQMGVDSGLLNLGGTGWNAHVGVTGGEITAFSEEKLLTGTMGFWVPFFGVYGVITHGNFFAD